MPTRSPRRAIGSRKRSRISTWASAAGSDFGFDFNTSFTEEQQRQGAGSYNFRPNTPFQEAAGDGPVAEIAAACGVDVPTYTREAPGMSASALQDGVVY